jgi:prepilin-type N-terminal cleavage/methylation domain-containing protein
VKTRFAFSLIELLVVVAIISLLLTILAPSLGRARDLVRRTVCAVNLRQLTSGMLLYADQHAGHAPPAFRTTSPMNFYFLYYDNRIPRNQAHLFDTDIIPDPSVYYCPSRPAPGQADDPFTPTHPRNVWDGKRVRTPYTTRFFDIDGRRPKQGVAYHWSPLEFGNRGVYAELFAVDGWRLEGIVQYQAHLREGWNVANGDASVRWITPGPLTSQASPQTPSEAEMLLFWDEIDSR